MAPLVTLHVQPLGLGAALDVSLDPATPLAELLTHLADRTGAAPDTVKLLLPKASKPLVLASQPQATLQEAGEPCLCPA